MLYKYDERFDSITHQFNSVEEYLNLITQVGNTDVKEYDDAAGLKFLVNRLIQYAEKAKILLNEESYYPDKDLELISLEKAQAEKNAKDLEV